MEKLNITTTKDNEKVYKILGDLMNANKEFQIMITVPSTKNAKDSTVKATEKREQTQEVIHDLEKDVTDMIHEIGVPAHIKGYQYLREAILITTADPSVLNKAVTKILYPEIARRYGTTALRVERCIRSAIETAWDRASPETLPKYFGCTVSSQRGKPSNAEFIALLAERLTLEDDQALRA